MNNVNKSHWRIGVSASSVNVSIVVKVVAGLRTKGSFIGVMVRSRVHYATERLEAPLVREVLLIARAKMPPVFRMYY